MNPIVRVILVALFVGGTLGALTIPIINASDEIADLVEPSPEPTPEETETPEPEPSPTPEPSSTPEDESSVTVVGRYPRSCLRPVDPPPGLGHIAFDDRQGVVIADLSTGTAGRLTEERAPLQWSPSGRYLLTRSGLLFGPDGSRQGSSAAATVGMSLWSPVADCLVTAVAGGIVVEIPGGAGPTRVVEEATGSIARLEMDKAGRRLRFRTPEGRLELNLRSMRLQPTERGAISGPWCGDTPLATFLNRDLLNDAFASACSPTGELVAGMYGATHLPPDLLLFGRDGSFVDDLAPNDGYADGEAIWGRAGTGIVFVRFPSAEGTTSGYGRPELWLIREGDFARDTGLRPLRGAGMFWRPTVLAWSAAIPEGRGINRGD